MTISTERIRQYATDEFMFAADDVRAMAAELLAVREAQPVAYRYRYNGKHLASAGCGDMVSSWKYCEEADLVNPDERYEHQALFTAPPAPVVPAAIEPTLEAIKAILPTANPDEYACCVGADMWNACRAAMLAAAPTPTKPEADGND